jgi:hypothetical protein
MVAAAALVVVLAVSLTAIRIGSVALVLTGVSQDVARFQAVSAFTSTGFTTAEAEKVTQHPVRRRIIVLLMVLGNAGVISLLGTLVLSFAGAADQRGTLHRLAIMACGVLALVLAARSRWLDRNMRRIIRSALRRWTSLEVADYADLLQLANGYLVMELYVEAADWMAGGSLAELQLNQEGINVMAIRAADGRYVGTPLGSSTVEAGDRLLLYGRREALIELDTRRKGPEGDVQHDRAVRRQREAVRGPEHTGNGPA